LPAEHGERFNVERLEAATYEKEETRTIWSLLSIMLGILALLTANALPTSKGKAHGNPLIP
jgi:hypothetical protein